MELIHNMAFRVLAGSDAGAYRVVLDEITIGKPAIVRLDTRLEFPRFRALRTLRQPVAM